MAVLILLDLLAALDIGDQSLFLEIHYVLVFQISPPPFSLFFHEIFLLGLLVSCLLISLISDLWCDTELSFLTRLAPQVKVCNNDWKDKS